MAKLLQLYASMHAHSTHSDGIYTPEELAEVGFQEGYKALVLTDLEYADFFKTCYGIHRGKVGPDVAYLDVNEIISLVHEAGGIACIAHPKHPYGSLEAAERLVKRGIDAIEVWHSLLTGSERRRALEIAKEYDLFVSGGADHEGLLGGRYIRYADPQKYEILFSTFDAGYYKIFL